MDEKQQHQSEPHGSVPRDPDDASFIRSFSINDKKEIHEFFDEFGFVVVRDVISPLECEKTLSELYDILEAGTDQKFQRMDMTTWNFWPTTGIPRFGQVSRPPIFTPQILLNRQNATLHALFSSLIGDDDLIVNHDRACLFRPTALNSHWATTDNLHLDMNPWIWLGNGESVQKRLDSLTYNDVQQFISENNQACHLDGLQLQCVLNLFDNYEHDGGFVCVPGFQHEFDTFFAPRKDLTPSYDMPSLSFDARAAPHKPILKRVIRIPMRAGSAVVWDQRLPHGSQPNRSGRIRSAQFFKMIPARGVTAARANVRAMALMRHLPTSVPISDLGRRLFGLEHKLLSGEVKAHIQRRLTSQAKSAASDEIASSATAPTAK